MESGTQQSLSHFLIMKTGTQQSLFTFSVHGMGHGNTDYGNFFVILYNNIDVKVMGIAHAQPWK